jgi:hypothetical protein
MAQVPELEKWMHEHLLRIEKLLFVIAQTQVLQLPPIPGVTHPELHRTLEELAEALTIHK